MILHVDIDCFFASAHRINNPDLENIPIAVGGRSNLGIFGTNNQIKEISKIQGAFTSSFISQNKNQSFDEYYKDKDGKIRGIITTSSYEARAYGVKTAMSIAEALRTCPSLKVLIPNYPLYHKLSKQLKDILEDELPLIEQFSIDEFFGDLHGWIKDEDAKGFAVNLKQRIQQELGLPVSIGLAPSKWIAKLCTSYAKPFGVKYLKACEVDAFIQNIPIKKFVGIGKAYQEKLAKYHIQTLGDIKDQKRLFDSWGKNGKKLYARICGDDKEEIIRKQERKSISLVRTFDGLKSRTELKRRIAILCRHLSFLCFKENKNPTSYSLHIKYHYNSEEKASKITNRLFSELILKEEALRLLEKIDKHPQYEVVQVGINLSNFLEKKSTTLDLLNYTKDKERAKFSKSLQELRERFGVDIIKNASEL